MDSHPIALQKISDQILKIKWSDKTETEYEVRKLRYNCSCAHCVNEWSGDRMVKLENIPKDVKPKKIDSVGNYAIKITWNDGHDSGIYSFQSLKNDLANLCTPSEEKKEHKGCHHDS